MPDREFFVAVQNTIFEGIKHTRGKIRKQHWRLHDRRQLCGIICTGGSRSVRRAEVRKIKTADYDIDAVLCIFPFYCLCAINQVYTGTLKGLGHTTFPMMCCLICYCMFRVIWCQVLLPHIWDIRVIYFSYDASWILMLVLLAFWYHRVMRGGEG